MNNSNKVSVYLTPESKFKWVRSAPELYSENTPAWHCQIDVATVCNRVGDEFTIGRMIQYHGLPDGLEYYETYLGELVEDGIIERVA